MHGKNLGTLRPTGGGDPVTLKKDEILIGRRPSCDIQLTFDNISGKHCQLRFHHQVWHVRDLGSTNGTTINGTPVGSEHTVMPDDELGIAGHFYTIDYDPGAPDAVLRHQSLLEVEDEDETEAPRRHSLMELAGLESEERRERKPPKKTAEPAEPAPVARTKAPAKPPVEEDDDGETEFGDDETEFSDTETEFSDDETEFSDDETEFGDFDESAPIPPPKKAVANMDDDDFFNLIQDEATGPKKP